MAKIDPKTYTSNGPVYVEGAIYHPGEPFTTSAVKGDDWVEAKPVVVAAANAASKQPDKQTDLDLDALDVPALKALAASKGLTLGNATSKADIITVIKAADEPAL